MKNIYEVSKLSEALAESVVEHRKEEAVSEWKDWEPETPAERAAGAWTVTVNYERNVLRFEYAKRSEALQFYGWCVELLKAQDGTEPNRVTGVTMTTTEVGA